MQRSNKLKPNLGKVKKSNKTVGKKDLPNSFLIFKNSFNTFKNNWRVLGGITLVYGLLSLFLVQSRISINNLNNEINTSALGRAAKDFSNLLSGFNTGDSLIQFVLFLLVGLAIVWATRRILVNEKVTTKQAYYQAMTPIVPVIILITLFLIQLLPMLLASTGLQFAFGDNFSSTDFESFVWVAIFILASWWSLHMITRTFVAIYMVTLPSMTPLQAMSKAKELVKGRRFSIMRKLLILPIIIFLALGVILIPTIMVASVLAGPLFLILSPLSVAFSVLYLFILYQEIIKNE